jgi:hypothetical protein
MTDKEKKRRWAIVEPEVTPVDDPRWHRTLENFYAVREQLREQTDEEVLASARELDSQSDM